MNSTKTKLILWYRVVLLGLQNFVRNTWLSVAASVVMVVAIAFVLLGVIFNITAQNVISHLSQNLKISVYLRSEVNSDEVAQLRNTLAAHEDVTQVTYIAPAEARDQFTENYEDDVDIKQAIALVGHNIFPPTLEVSVDDLNQIQQVGQIAQQPQYESLVDSISLGKTDAQQTIDNATEIQNFLIRLSIAFALIFIFIAFLMIVSTIRMAIFSRREEIQIMRLIGAPMQFIRNPFLVEAVLLGLIAGILSSLLIYGLILFFADKITSVPEFVSSYEYFTDNLRVVFFIFAGSTLTGVLVGFISCSWTLQRYLRF